MRKNTSSRDSWHNKSFGEKSWQGGGGGSTTELFYAGATLSVQGGQELVALSGVYGIKRAATLATATNFPSLHSTARGRATLSTGTVSGVNIIHPGAGYSSAPNVTFSAPPAGGTQATGTAVLGGKFIEAIEVTNCGSGVGNVSFTITGGGGTGASASGVVVGGKLVAVNVNGGRGFTSAPTITVNAVGATVTPTVNPIMSKTDGVISVTITNAGSGYTTSPTVTFTNPPALSVVSDPYDDSFGWARVSQSIFGSSDPTVNTVVRVVNDLGSAFPYAIHVGETLLTFHSEYRRLSTEDADARGCILCWVPDGVLA